MSLGRAVSFFFFSCWGTFRYFGLKHSRRVRLNRANLLKNKRPGRYATQFLCLPVFVQMLIDFLFPSRFPRRKKNIQSRHAILIRRRHYSSQIIDGVLEKHASAQAQSVEIERGEEKRAIESISRMKVYAHDYLGAPSTIGATSSRRRTKQA